MLFRRRLFAILVLGGILAGSPMRSAVAGAPASFRFYGAGYGHGVGMGADGAYGMALGGWSAGAILHHFYPGVTIAKGKLPSFVRVGLVQAVPSVPVRAAQGSVVLRLSNPATGTLVASIPQGETWTVFVRDGAYWIRRASGTYVGGHAWGGASHNLYAAFGGLGAMVYLPQRGHTYDHGFLELNIYRPCGSCSNRLRVIQQLGPESYVQGVGEEPSSRPTAMLRAFAIAARTYITYKVSTVGQHRPGCNCGIWWVGEQFYLGYRGPGDLWAKATADTSGLMLLYGGHPIIAAYSASSGGWTESSSEAWGWAAPYLRSVCDPGDYNPYNPTRTWAVTLSQAAVRGRLYAHVHIGIGDVTAFQVLSRASSGRIDSVTVVGTKGSYTISGNTFRDALGLRTALVWINTNRLITGEVRAKYDKLMCAPGLPASPLYSPTGGHLQIFLHGAIYVDDVHVVSTWLRGIVLDKYRSLKGPGGRLGWPSSGVVASGAWRTAKFVHGSIRCSVTSSACTVTYS